MHNINEDVQRDAQSGEWMFGRGSVDMQSGIAVHLANVLHFTKHRDQLEGNVLLWLILMRKASMLELFLLFLS